MIPVSQTGLVATEDRNLAPLFVGAAVVLLAAGAIAVVAIRRRRTWTVLAVTVTVGNQ